jgi:hypothetical protein
MLRWIHLAASLATKGTGRNATSGRWKGNSRFLGFRCRSFRMAAFIFRHTKARFRIPPTEVEALGVVVAASVLDGEGVAPEPLDGSCFASYLVIPKGLNLSGRSKLRSRGEKAGKQSPSPAVVDFFRRSSSIFWRAS